MLSKPRDLREGECDGVYLFIYFCGKYWLFIDKCTFCGFNWAKGNKYLL
jgi:hypothetical protein